MKISCFTCKYGYEDERLGIPMCHHPRRFSEDCVNFNMHEEKETEESKKPMKQEKEVEPCHRTRKRLAEWSKTQEGRESYEKVAEEMRKQIVTNDLEEAATITLDEAESVADEYTDFLAKGLIENQPRPIGGKWFVEYARKRFIAGAKWDREKMMSEAVEGTVMDFSSNQPRPQIDVFLDPYKYQTGDKVRVIIVKEN